MWSQNQDGRKIGRPGNGSAGCALARRLSDSGEHSVLVLEVGIIPDPGPDVPGSASSIPQRSSDLENVGGRDMKIPAKLPPDTTAPIHSFATFLLPWNSANNGAYHCEIDQEEHDTNQ
ncbi:unnamed protein product [Orchesella dallaii]|uniref:Uncharacterized protein n=1 Tax=Orchesella dallaii TaxID=48710 RepID=A0ABP1PMJ1_9HEXA